MNEWKEVSLKAGVSTYQILNGTAMQIVRL
jgi:hypothetical protein